MGDIHTHHRPATDDISDSRLLWAMGINHLLTVAQVIAGVLSGSIALLSDAAHNFNDANALLIAYIARRVGRKRADEHYTFGYRRAELVGAIINLTLLGAIGLYLVYHAIERFIDPQPILGWLMAAAAGLALVIDVGTAWLLWAMSKGSMNVKAAFIHNLTDALGSVAVLLGAAAVIWLDWMWMDPALTLMIAGYVLYQVATMLPQAARVLMEGTPQGVDLRAMAEDLAQLDGVEGVHHLHLWDVHESHRAFEAHVVIQAARLAEWETIKTAIKRRLEAKYQVNNSTLEVETIPRADDPNHDESIVPEH